MESQVFLQTKLQPSLMAGRSLNRARLLRELNRDPHPRLFLITGPAGSGKSTLMFDFIAQRSLRVAWLSLGDEDQDPLVFFSYFLESLCQKFPGSCQQTRNSLQEWHQSHPDDATHLASSLINELLSFREPISIALDDFHLVKRVPLVTQFITLLLRRGPTNLSLMLTSRDLPELPLPWLRSKRVLVEMHEDSLRFTEEETEALFQEVWGQPLEPELVKLLLDKTEGWATGLQLVAQAIRGRSQEEIKKYIEALEGRDEVIYTYLATEVFQAQPGAVQDFLVVTSVPDSFNPSLAAELAPEHNVHEMIQHLRVARLFLVQLDREGEWFRYHHLFRDFLRSQLQTRRGQVATEALHYKTANWIYDHDDVVASVPHFLASGDPTLASEILEKAGSELLHRGLRSSVVRWLEALPARHRHSRPGLQVLQAEIADLQGQWSRAVEGYESALETYRRLDQPREIATVLEKLSLCYIKYGETKQLLKACEEGLLTCPADNPALKSMLKSWLGVALVVSGQDWPRGYDSIKTAHSQAFECADPRAISWACLAYGFLYHFPQGNFDEALRGLNEGIDYFSRLGWPMVLYQLTMNKALVLLIRGDLLAASRLVDETLLEARRASHTYVTKGLENIRGMIYLELGQLPECRQMLSAVAQAEIPAQFKPWFFRNRLMLHTLEGNFEQARVDAEEMERILLLQGSGMYAPECFISHAFLLTCLRDFGEAEQRLRMALRLCEKSQSKFWEMKAQMMLAWLSHRRGDRDNLLLYLRLALMSSQTNHYETCWLADSWGVTIPLLFQALAANLESEYVQRCLAKMDPIWLTKATELLEESDDTNLRLAIVGQLGKSSREQARQVLKNHSKADRDPLVLQEARKMLRLPLYDHRLYIACLGPLRIYRDGEVLNHAAQARPQTIRLLKFFLVQGDQMVAVDKIVEVFWPNAGLEKARHNLSQQLSNLRRFLGAPNALQFFGDSYRLFAEGEGNLDVAEFESHYVKGLNLLKRGQSEEAEGYLLQAESLYRGEFLEEDSYEDWIEDRRRKLTAAFENLNESLGDLYLQRGSHDKALSRYRRLLHQDEPQERLFQKAFQCYEALGDRQGARRDYEILRGRLKEGAGVEPQESTRALLESLFLQN